MIECALSNKLNGAVVSLQRLLTAYVTLYDSFTPICECTNLPDTKSRNISHRLTGTGVSN